VDQEALDIGPAGVLVPLVNTAETAALRGARLPICTEGVRDGRRRAHRYGIGFQDYVAQANQKIAAIVQAEHIEAVKNIEAIVKVPGIDAVFVGPTTCRPAWERPVSSAIRGPGGHRQGAAGGAECGREAGHLLPDADSARSFCSRGTPDRPEHRS
jgi:2-keto-3-deoxy-L-rhamnonate aldolase RhmA